MSHTALSVLIVTVAFLLYHFISSHKKLMSWLQVNHGAECGQILMVVFRRLLGALLFGCTSIFNLVMEFPIKTDGTAFRYKPILFLLVLIPILVNILAAKSTTNLAMYPQIRTKVWSKGLLILSALTWMIYLLGYELMFRGMLFANGLRELGLISAIAINISIYALVHIPKGLNETLGALPLGIIFCLLAWITGSFWASFALHCMFALSNEWFSIMYSNKSA